MIMAAGKDAMWSKMTNIVRKYVSKDGLDDETLAEYLGDTVNKDYKVCFSTLFQCRQNARYFNNMTFIFCRTTSRHRGGC